MFPKPKWAFTEKEFMTGLGVFDYCIVLRACAFVHMFQSICSIHEIKDLQLRLC